MRRLCIALLALLAATLLLPEVLRPAPGQTLVRPNILLILTDDQTVESLTSATMPYTKGRADWVRFSNAILNVALCCPSRATILTGRYSHHTGIEANNGAKFNETVTIATALRAGGYRTGLIGKYLNDYPFGRGHYIPPGWDYWVAFENRQSGGAYFNYTLNENGTPVSYGATAADYSTDVLAAKAASFIRTATSPFFLYFAPNAPHKPLTPAPRYAGSMTGVAMPHAPNFREADVTDKPAWVQNLSIPSADTMDKQRRREYETLRAVDDAVRQLFDALAAKGALDSTVVMFLTDNGFAFGEHRWTYKLCEYEECGRTPLLARGPGWTPRTVTAVVSNVDLAPTFADLAGVAPPYPPDGASLVPLLTGTASSVHNGVLIRWKGGSRSVPAFWGVRTDRYKYVELATGERELYDLQADPYELQNRHGDPAFAQLEANLAAQLAALKR